MLQYSTYSVISPEGCASILWKSSEKAQAAASAMKITSESLKQNGLVDEIVMEPLGGAHRNPDQMADHLRDALCEQLDPLRSLSSEELLVKREKRLRSFGRFRDGS
jgi:acetyl-CoA carboxylase carboxyl transferase subunit alpha